MLLCEDLRVLWRPIHTARSSNLGLRWPQRASRPPDVEVPRSSIANWQLCAIQASRSQRPSPSGRRARRFRAPQRAQARRGARSERTHELFATPATSASPIARSISPWLRSAPRIARALPRRSVRSSTRQQQSSPDSRLRIRFATGLASPTLRSSAARPRMMPGALIDAETGHFGGPLCQ
jgi:hypothetical protein